MYPNHQPVRFILACGKLAIHAHVPCSSAKQMCRWRLPSACTMLAQEISTSEPSRLRQHDAAPHRLDSNSKHAALPTTSPSQYTAVQVVHGAAHKAVPAVHGAVQVAVQAHTPASPSPQLLGATALSRQHTCSYQGMFQCGCITLPPSQHILNH